jgi:hypothetical protein
VVSFDTPLVRYPLCPHRFRPVNESEPNSVPPANSPVPSEPIREPSAAPSAPAASVPSDSSAAASSPSAADKPAASSADSSRADATGTAPAGEAGGERQAGGDGEGEGSDGQKRRRRRRRRRKTGAEGEGGEGGADAASSADGATEGVADGATADGSNSEGAGDQPAAGGARAKRVRKPRPKKERGRNEGGRSEGGRSERVGNERGRNERGGRDGARRDDGRNDRRRGGDSQHSATVAVRALAEMARALLHIEGVDSLAMPRYLDLQLRVPLDGGNDVRHAAGTAVEQILERVREVREHEQAMRPGAVYSYFSDSSHEEGCRPIEPRHVFDGYSSTGKPKFADFVTVAIERKDPEIERMLSGEEIVLTHVTMGRVLRTQQLAEFGGNSPVFKILGQVNAGLFRVLGDAGRCAFSFQLLRGKTLEGRVRLRLHPVGAVDPMDLADPALLQILSRFQRKLDTEALRLEGRLKAGEVDEEEFVLPLLQEFAKQLQSRTRNTGRRTQHGTERSEEGLRPTAKAYPDAGEANDASILWDIDQSTVVVLGPKGRVHVFSPQAKHVTSVSMQRPAIERRRQQGRWRLAEPEERGEFRIQIKMLIASGKDDPASDAVVPEQAAGSSPAAQPVQPAQPAQPASVTPPAPVTPTVTPPTDASDPAKPDGGSDAGTGEPQA